MAVQLEFASKASAIGRYGLESVTTYLAKDETLLHEPYQVINRTEFSVHSELHHLR